MERAPDNPANLAFKLAYTENERPARIHRGKQGGSPRHAGLADFYTHRRPMQPVARHHVSVCPPRLHSSSRRAASTICRSIPPNTN